MIPNAIPIVAIIGRPNVGKSAFLTVSLGKGSLSRINRRVLRVTAFIIPGSDGIKMILVDTGGMEYGKRKILKRIYR